MDNKHKGHLCTHDPGWGDRSRRGGKQEITEAKLCASQLMLLVLLPSSLASAPLHYICWNSTWELLSDASIAACGSHWWLKPTGTIVLWLQSPSNCQGPPRDSSLAWGIETSSLQLIMLDSLDIFLVMTFPTVYLLAYFAAWQYTL